MQEVTIEKLIEQTLNISPLDIKEDTAIDIIDKNKKIWCYNHKNEQNEFQLISKIIRKKDDYQINVKLENDTLIKCTKDHKFYILYNGKNQYLKVFEILFLINEKIEVFLKTENDYVKIKSITETKIKVPIFDLEVENNHNFYSNSVLSHNSFSGAPAPSGGSAIGFYSHVRIWVTRSEIDKDTLKNTVKFNFIKNKLGIPFNVAKSCYDWKNGFDITAEFSEIAIEAGIIKKEKTSFILPEVEEKLVGKKKLEEYLKSNPEYIKTIIQPKVEEYLNNLSEVLEEEKE